MAFPTTITRRHALLSGFALAVLVAQPVLAQGIAVHVVKGTGCECCNAWVAYLRDAGFSVTEEERYGTLLMTHKTEAGVPQKMISCHTGMVEGYALEGHVPAADRTPYRAILAPWIRQKDRVFPVLHALALAGFGLARKLRRRPPATREPA